MPKQLIGYTSPNRNGRIYPVLRDEDTGRISIQPIEVGGNDEFREALFNVYVSPHVPDGTIVALDTGRGRDIQVVSMIDIHNRYEGDIHNNYEFSMVGTRTGRLNCSISSRLTRNRSDFHTDNLRKHLGKNKKGVEI